MKKNFLKGKNNPEERRNIRLRARGVIKEKIYTTPFTTENVLAALEKAPPSMADGRLGKISYKLKKQGTTNTISASNQEEFINGNFDELWDYHMRPQPQINISGKDLTNYLKQDAAAKEKHQYQ